MEGGLARGEGARKTEINELSGRGGVGWGWFGMGLISGAATAGYFTNMRG